MVSWGGSWQLFMLKSCVKDPPVKNQKSSFLRTLWACQVEVLMWEARIFFAFGGEGTCKKSYIKRSQDSNKSGAAKGWWYGSHTDEIFPWVSPTYTSALESKRRNTPQVTLWGMCNLDPKSNKAGKENDRWSWSASAETKILNKISVNGIQPHFSKRFIPIMHSWFNIRKLNNVMSQEKR